ncbi:MAG TPA: periplasmic heavy metal sensor [Pyrinomonadaceae bacterium]|jgi:Spy/CpxP family protein refolding chaperone|nr:periplasmic heavy metal sensor [Pyrinomonadaceae bacterium]
MDKINRNRWQVRAAAVLIFLLGCAAGALALNAYRAWARGGGAQMSRQDRFEQMLDRLQISAEQKAGVQQILGDTREQLQALRKESEPRVKEIRRQADERLQKVLTPEQWKQFQQMRDEMRSRGRRGKGGGGGGD